MPVVITYTGAKPTVGADEDTWGTELNNDALAPIKVDLDALAALANATETTANTANSTANTAQTTANRAAPAGAVMAFARSTPPTGWLECDGSAVSRTTYAALFAACGTFFGAGDGSTTFNLPNLRGEFVRGWDNGRGVDPARGFGSFQADAFASHTHAVPEGAPTPPAFGGQYTSGDDMTNLVETFSTSGSTGGTETRPRNIALMYCIRTGL